MRFALIFIAAALALSACGQSGDSSVMAEIEKREAQDAAEREAAKAKALGYLQENAKQPGVTTTESGLQIQIVRASKNPKLATPSATDEVTVHYEGTRVDGSVFDSSYQRGEPTSFPLDQVIPGWTEALQLMRPGDEARLVIPPELGYGDQGPAPGEPLVFKVELLSFKNARGAVVSAPK